MTAPINCIWHISIKRGKNVIQIDEMKNTRMSIILLHHSLQLLKPLPALIHLHIFQMFVFHFSPKHFHYRMLGHHIVWRIRLAIS